MTKLIDSISFVVVVFIILIILDHEFHFNAIYFSIYLNQHKLKAVPVVADVMMKKQKH